ncbi:MAG: hypothetical protein DRN49_04105 [Thaumarchaeota archaeon]|nr:MAG: hypothetical protein DRN49_04105 [Nitrososphaerota archaeon]
MIDVKFEGIDTTKEWRDRLFYIQTGVSASEVLRMQTVEKAAESLSKSPGAAVGAGIAVIPPLFYPPTSAQQSRSMITCPKCGFQNPVGAKFCQNCGSPLQQQPQGIKCPKCGTINPPGAKFCINCGTSLQSTTKCPKCGAEIPSGAKFCPNCGTKLI